MNRRWSSALPIGVGAALNCFGTVLIGRFNGTVSLLLGAACLGTGLPLLVSGMWRDNA